jgi:hypothetical protein
MTCKCGSKLIISISGKCSDLCFVTYTGTGKNIEKDGYVPHDLGVGGGDEVEFDFCGACGLIQGFKPLTDAEIRCSIKGDDEDSDEDDYDEDNYDPITGKLKIR